MKLIRKILAVTGVATILFATFLFPVSAEYYDVDRNYTTSSYHTDITLSEKNVYHVEETIEVNFLNRRHGIYRYIPYKGYMNYEENGVPKKTKYRANIKNVKVQGYDYSKDTEGGNVVLQIGDEDTYVNGKQTYRISFDFDAGDDKIESFDKIYINLLPTGWQTEVDRASFTLTLPKEVDASKINFFSGAYGEYDTVAQEKFDIAIEGNKITGVSKQPLEAFEGATIYAEVAEGYFTGERTDLPLTILMWVLILAVPVLAGLLYLRFGRDEPIIKMVTITPPKEMTPAEVGFIMDSTVDNKDMLSLIIYWADKGYLTIEESGEDFILTVRDGLPQDCNKYERTMFDGLFDSGKTTVTQSMDGTTQGQEGVCSVNTADLKSKFYPTLELAKTQLRTKFSKGKLYTKGSRVSQGLIQIFSLLPFAAAAFISGYLAIVNNFYLVVAGVGCAVLLVTYVCGYVMAEKWYIMSKGAKVGGVIALILVCAVTYLSMVAMIFWQGIPLVPIIVAIIGSSLSMLLACVMPRRTKQCNDWFGELLGLREFIELAEKERIEMLVNEDPRYFYNILPYAYVLGVSDTWAKRFEGIAISPPDWYAGGSFQPSMFNTYLFMRSFQHCMNNMQQTLSVPPVQTGNGSSGGFSGGGGGFSGGGFSGGGGGSW